MSKHNKRETPKIWFPGKKEIATPKPQDISIYITAPEQQREQAHKTALTLRAHAVEIASKWHEEDAPVWDIEKKNAHDVAGSRFIGILNADWLLQISPTTKDPTDNTFVELGFAIGIRKPILIMGAPVNMFQCLPICKQFGSIEELLLGLQTARVRGARMMQAADQVKQQAVRRLKNMRGESSDGQRSKS